jgi:IS605 OrfB family transposase
VSGQILTIKLRIRDKHASELRRQAKAVNFVWNYLNETSRKAWTRDRRWLSAFELINLTSGSSTELNIHGHTIQEVCKQFAKARDKVRRAGVRWRSKRSLGWVPFNTGQITFDGSTIKFRGLRYEPMHLQPKLKAGMKIGAGSFNQDGRGRWYANMPVTLECSEATSPSHIGIDLGLKTLATMSDGAKIEMPSFHRKSEIALAAAHRARKTRRARSIYAKVANRRKDFLHKASKAIATEHGVIVIGDVSPSKLARTKLAKSVLDAGWSDFKRMLSYKAPMHGGAVIEVSERMSTQTCSECGALPTSRPKGIAGLGIREWACDDCGAVLDRDVNAARNILRVGLHALVEGARTGAGSSQEAVRALCSPLSAEIPR